MQAPESVPLSLGELPAQGDSRFRARLVRLRHLVSDLGAMFTIGVVLLVLIGICALAAPWLAPYDPVAPVGSERLSGPSAEHWLGTDMYGRDMLSRILYGARVSMIVGFVVTSTIMVVGTVAGMLGATLGGVVDAVIGRIIDLLLAVPGILLAISILAVLGPGVQNVCIALIISRMPVMVRVVRGTTLSVKERQFVRSARAVGCSGARVLLVHVAPFVLGVAVVQATIIFADVVLYEAALSFLGIGVQPPHPTWGNMISDAGDFLSLQPLNTVFPGIALSLLVLSVNFIGDGLRDVFDTESRGR